MTFTMADVSREISCGARFAYILGHGIKLMVIAEFVVDGFSRCSNVCGE